MWTYTPVYCIQHENYSFKTYFYFAKLFDKTSLFVYLWFLLKKWIFMAFKKMKYELESQRSILFNNQNTITLKFWPYMILFVRGIPFLHSWCHSFVLSNKNSQVNLTATWRLEKVQNLYVFSYSKNDCFICCKMWKTKLIKDENL